MQIPQDLQPHFPVATLILIADHVHAQPYLAGGDAMEPLDGIAMPRLLMTDREMTNSGQGAHDNEHQGAEHERQHAYIKLLAETMEDAIESGSAERIFLAMPAEIAHALRKELPTKVNDAILREAHVEVTKEEPTEVLRRFF